MTSEIFLTKFAEFLVQSNARSLSLQHHLQKSLKCPSQTTCINWLIGKTCLYLYSTSCTILCDDHKTLLPQCLNCKLIHSDVLPHNQGGGGGGWNSTLVILLIQSLYSAHSSLIAHTMCSVCREPMHRPLPHQISTASMLSSARPAVVGF